MPGGDRTGPVGAGPRTGRAAGFCAGYDVPGYMNPVPGRGFGFGRGRGGGWGRGWRHRHWFYATGMPGWARGGQWAPWGAPGLFPAASQPTAEQETEYLKGQADWLKSELETINKRLEELTTKE